ncbi:NinE family protein, partial [Escherichia coli]|nr:NinE family protein [Escherichia coli]
DVKTFNYTSPLWDVRWLRRRARFNSHSG